MTEIQSLARGLKILNLLAASEDSVGITEIAAYLGMDKSSISRVMQTLASYGYAEQDSFTRRYRLGPQVVVLGQTLLERTPLRDHARPYLQQLVDRTGECAHLGVLAQGQVLYLDQVESSATLRVNTRIGTLAPLHCTALGKTLLSVTQVEPPQELAAFTTRTITNREALRLHLDQARRQGYAVDDEEYNYDVRCVAAPVFDHAKKVVGAIGISGPAGRMSLERIPETAAIVCEVAKALSNRFSFRQR
ncbi:MAG: IclR family transcriptional regulator [Chloroflexi bacterium]|nr:IclR family transcriptional regulator [Chloroflexota bacterium]